MTDRSRSDAGSGMEPETKVLQAELSDEQWLLIADLFANPETSPKSGRPMADPRPRKRSSHFTSFRLRLHYVKWLVCL